MNESQPARSTIEPPRTSVPQEEPEHPPFIDALLADARVAAAYRGERHEFRSRLDGVLQVLRLMLQTDAFIGLAAYRLKARLRARGIPVLPWLAHRLAMAFGQISIADTAVVHPGVFIPNGQVVIYGLAEVQPFTTILPWVTIGPAGPTVAAPTIRPGVVIATGAKVLGDVEVGPNSRVGVNAVVLEDVPANTTVVGMPARAITE